MAGFPRRQTLLGRLSGCDGRAVGSLGLFGRARQASRGPAMLTVLVANTKGGCGKTTVATQLAAAFASIGHAVTLADVDRQRSSLGWTGRRPSGRPAVAGLDWVKDLGKPPGDGRLVIDAPAAMKMKQVEELVKLADLVLLPVLPSVFDEAATERFLARLDEVKRVRKSRTAVAVVGNRVRPNTLAARRLDDYLAGVGQRALARLRDSALYPDTAARGLSLFDLPAKRGVAAREDWAPLLEAIEGRMPAGRYIAGHPSES
jgi:chromosome partitioning protein